MKYTIDKENGQVEIKAGHRVEARLPADSEAVIAKAAKKPEREETNEEAIARLNSELFGDRG